MMKCWMMLMLCAVLVLPGMVWSATPGKDTADDPAYQKNPPWNSGDNGGKGFVGWNLVASDNSGEAGFKVGDSKSINSDINSSGGRAFGLFAKGAGRSAEAYRTFDAPLNAGQSFSVALAVNFRSGLKGLDIRTPASDGERTIFNFTVGGDDYAVHNAKSGNGSAGSAYDARTSFVITLNQTSDAGGTWTVVRSGGVSGSISGTYEGRAAGAKYFVRDTDGGKENEMWINNLTISSAAP